MQDLQSRLFTIGLTALLVFGTSAAGSEAPSVAVVMSSNAPAFEDAVTAFQTALGEEKGRLFLVALEANGNATNLTKGARPRLAIAFGSRALEAVAAADPALPLLATMVLAGDPAANAKPQKLLSTVSLSLSPAAILSQLKSTFPSQRRLAVLLGPQSKLVRNELLAVAQRFGYSLDVVECGGPRDVLEWFAMLRGRVDFVWCLPDSSLFPPAAVSPMILASIRNRLPLIGFSEGFVRAGATVGFYPDYADIGRQTAEMLKRHLFGQTISQLEAPRQIRMAVNDRVMRMLGIERPNLSNEVLIVR